MTGHLVRGAVGFGTIGCAFALAPSHPWVLIAAIPIALFALRGCPMCWTMGLVETIGMKLRGRDPGGRCIDGSCAVTRPSSVENPGVRRPRTEG